MLLGVEKDKGAFQDVDEFGRPMAKDSHQLAQAQKEKKENCLLELQIYLEHFMGN